MIMLVLFLAGFAIGWMRAGRRGGGRADRIQFALAHAIPGFLLGLLITVIGMHQGWGL